MSAFASNQIRLVVVLAYVVLCALRSDRWTKFEHNINNEVKRIEITAHYHFQSIVSRINMDEKMQTNLFSFSDFRQIKLLYTFSNFHRSCLFLDKYSKWFITWLTCKTNFNTDNEHIFPPICVFAHRDKPIAVVRSQTVNAIETRWKLVANKNNKQQQQMSDDGRKRWRRDEDKFTN